MTPPRDSADGPPPSPLASLLRELADVVDGASPADCPDETVRQVVLALVALSGLVDAELAAWVGAFDANTLWAGDGARSGGGWVAARTELSAARAAGIVATARALRACPVIEPSYRSGKLGTAKVLALLRAREEFADLFAEHEAYLVATVEHLTVAHAQLFLRRWAALAEATRAAEERERAGEHPDDGDSADPLADNELHLSMTLDGRWVGDLDLDAASGTQLAEAIGGVIDRKFHDGTYWNGDGVTMARRRIDALVELALRGAVPNQTKHGDPRPSVSVHLDERTLRGEPVEDIDDLATRRCHLDDGTPVSRTTAERLLCTARVTTLLHRMTEDGTIETVGITDLLRDATARQRKALRERDGGCVFPGCSAPFDWCEAHHLTPYEDGGPTLLANLATLCSHHHHLVHEGGWTLWRHTDGHLHLVKPDGSHVEMVRRGHKIDPDQRQPPVGPAPPPRPPRRTAEPRFLTRREQHDREHRRQQAERPGDERPPPPPAAET
ncbi:DUF222 domain-containing protein [Aquihabitans sp. McL0605]|uniref:HNH endonuclease signature motif containing protein n=1 Tax=Aquihabitans sp. McL0605 TaxID=3415671 RepID=UPI003CF6127B